MHATTTINFVIVAFFNILKYYLVEKFSPQYFFISGKTIIFAAC